MSKSTILDDSVLATLLQDRRIIDALPFLQSYTGKKQKSCTACSSRKSFDYNAVKAQIATLSDSDKTTLKKLLNTDTIRVVYAVGTKIVDVTF